MTLDKSLPFPEPQFPPFKAKAASHLLLFLVAGVMTPPDLSSPGTAQLKDDNPPGGCWQPSRIITISGAPYLSLSLCVLNLIQTSLLVVSWVQAIEGSFVEMRKEKVAHRRPHTATSPTPSISEAPGGGNLSDSFPWGWGWFSKGTWCLLAERQGEADLVALSLAPSPLYYFFAFDLRQIPYPLESVLPSLWGKLMAE